MEKWEKTPKKQQKTGSEKVQLLGRILRCTKNAQIDH